MTLSRLSLLTSPMAPPRRSAASVIDAHRLMAYSSVEFGAMPAWVPAWRSSTIQASPPSRVSKLRLIRRPRRADDAQWMRFTLSVGTYSRMLVAFGGTSRTRHPLLFVARGARREGFQGSDRTDHRVHDDGSAPRDPQGASEEAERIAEAELHRPEGEQPALLELSARGPAPGAAALQAEHATGVVVGEVGEIRQLDQRYRDPGTIRDRKMFLELVPDLVLTLGTVTLDDEIVSRQPAPEIADEKEEHEGIEEAVGEPDARDVREKEEQRQRRDEREARKPH